MRTLHLTLKGKPFEVMITGEKDWEFRKPSAWITARLKNVFTHIRFTHGYGSDRPYFIVKAGIVAKAIWPEHLKYSNGLEVIVNVGDYCLSLGEIVEKGNLK